MRPTTKDDKKNKKLKGTQKIQASRPITSKSNQKSIPRPVSNKNIEVSPVIGTGRKDHTIKSAALECASIRKRSHCGYVTLLDIGMMNKVALPASRILPTEELIPNSYHQSFHVARWRTWLRQTPQVLISMCLVE
jgi:hypothetical protein